MSYPLEVTLWVGAVGLPADGHVAVAATLLTGLWAPGCVVLSTQDKHGYETLAGTYRLDSSLQYI